jgi:hypothetical protein
LLAQSFATDFSAVNFVSGSKEVAILEDLDEQPVLRPWAPAALTWKRLPFALDPFPPVQEKFKKHVESP